MCQAFEVYNFTSYTGYVKRNSIISYRYGNRSRRIALIKVICSADMPSLYYQLIKKYIGF